MKSTAKAPTPPDPTVTAAAQTQSNKDTASYQQALNLINQNTPLGSITYNNIGTDPTTGAPRYESNVSLSPSGQKSFDLQQQVGEALNNLALKGTGQVSSAFDTSQNYDNLPKTSGLDTSALPAAGKVDLTKAPNAPTGLDLSSLSPVSAYDPTKFGSLKSFDTSGLASAPTSIDVSNLPELPKGLDLSTLGDAPTANDALRQQAADTLYKQSTSRLDPQWQLDQQRLENQLTQKGIAQGSDAWKNAMESFQRSRNDAYDQARNDSILNAVNYETGQYNLENNAYTTKRDTLQQQFADALNANNQGFGQAQAKFGAGLASRQQGVSELQQAVADALANRQQQSSEAQTANTTSSNNRAQGLNEQEAAFQAGQAARGQNINEQLSLAGLNDQQRAQALAEQEAANATNLTNRQQGITEANYLRELPINEISSLLNGGQVTMPQFTNTPQTSVAGTNVAGIIQNDYQNKYQNYQTQLQQQNAAIGSIFGLAGSVLGGWATGGFA